MITVPWRPQGDKSAYQWVNCALVAAGRGMKQQLAGLRTPSSNLIPWNSSITKLTYGWTSRLPTMASAMRSWLLTHVSSGLTGGVTIPDAWKAAQGLWGAITGWGYRYNVSFDDVVVPYIKAGRGVHVYWYQGDVHNTPYDGFPGWNGRHSIYVCAGGIRYHTWTDSFGVSHSRWEVYVYCSGCDHRASYIPQGPFWMPLSVFRRAVLAAFGNTGDTEFAFTRDVIA